MAEKVEIKFFKIKNITQARTKDSLFLVKADSDTTFKLYVTDLDGNLIPLFTSPSGITNITNIDGSVTITGSNVKDLKVSTVLQNLINSALQANDPISSLLNDAGYLTLSDLPTFNPSDYDLEDFTNTSADPFVRQSEVGTGSGANLAYTPSPTQGIITSDTGSDAVIPLADNVNAGLINSAEKSKIATAVQPTDLGVVATSNDYNDLDNIPTVFPPSTHTHVEADITDLDKYTQSEVDNLLDDKVDKVVGKSLIDDTEITRLASVTNFDNSGNVTALANKVDKIIGKGLSTEDYTTTEKTKLSGIEIGAEVNVNADWNATSGDAQILNKPTIPSIVGLATETYVDAKVEDTIVNGVTTKAPSQNAVLNALQLKSDIIFSDGVTESGIAVTTEQKLKSYLIPANSIADGSNLLLNIKFVKTAGGGAAHTLRVYVNTSDTLVGATLIGFFNSSVTTTQEFVFQRNITIKGSNLSVLNTSVSTTTDLVTSNTTPSSIAFNRAVNQYLIISVQSAAGHILQIAMANLIKN